jgi:uncharacterized repeat protein (TIGR01451 family)
MNKLNKFKLAALVAASVLWTQGAHALGTAAGFDIQNTARADYNIGVGGPGAVVNSNTITTTVDELLNATVTWQDAAPVTVASGNVNKVTTYLLTNTGNGSENFNLSRLNTLAGDQFDPTSSSPNSIFLDTNGNGTYDVGVDLPATQSGVLAANGTKIIFLLSDISAGPHADGDTANVQLTAAAVTGTGAPGTVFAGAGDGGVIAAVVGSTGGDGAAVGTYIISGAIVTMTKSAVIADPFGGTQAVPGATITYTITATVTGTGTAANLVVTDLVPAGTAYVVGSIKLNAVALTDGGGDDAGDYNNTNAGSVTVDLGNQTSPGATPQVVTFKALIN